MSKDKNRKLNRQKFFAFETNIYSSLKVWLGLKKTLPTCELAALNVGIILSPQNMREMIYTSVKSWSGCRWKKPSLDLLTHAVDERVLMTPCHLKGAGDSLLVHLNSYYSTARLGDTRSSAQSSSFCGGTRTIGERHNVPEKGS